MFEINTKLKKEFGKKGTRTVRRRIEKTRMRQPWKHDEIAQ